ncbi:hypothetical protein QFC20_004310 [Naganishia adeliensis]|uniref:Uncharacterized protein n=1 Tax=Naganishia adeliensis TaxID=92952 RepID=A0ACC2W3E6_9TREE|nr:hypothetical protein QFC20_004310 [Naganishia adeliensis]
MSDTAPNTISPQQGGLAGTTVGNVPGAAKTGLGVADPSLPTPKQDVIGDPEIAAGTKLEPLEKDQGSTRDAQTILDDLSNSATGQSATEALSSAQAAVTSALGSATTAAQGLANQAYDAVMNATGTAETSKK